MDTGIGSSPSPLTTEEDEFEGLEVAEFDANVLWELLHDQPGEEEAAASGGGEAPMEADSPKPDTLVDSLCCLNDFIINNNNNNNIVQDFDWFHLMEETSLACNEMGGWYVEPCMEEILEIGDYSILSDEIGYIGLWLDN